VYELEGHLQQQLDRCVSLEDTVRTRTQELSLSQKSLREARSKIASLEQLRTNAAIEVGDLVQALASAVHADSERRNVADQHIAALTRAIGDVQITSRAGADSVFDGLKSSAARLQAMQSSLPL